MDGGTPRELAMLAEQVLAWVATQRSFRRHGHPCLLMPDDLRRIELCALAAQEQVLLGRWLGLDDSEPVA